MADPEAENEPENRSEPPGGGPFLAGRVIAGLLELTERRLQQLVSEGWIPRGQRGQYSLRDSVRGYIRYLKQHSREQQRGTEAARLSRAQAIKVEMENYRRMGELQPTSQIEDLMQGLIVMMKSAHEGLPGRLASELAGISEPPRVYQRLQTELRAILNQCADYLEKRSEALAAVPEPGQDASALGAHDADEVGGGESDHAAGQPGAGEI